MLSKTQLLKNIHTYSNEFTDLIRAYVQGFISYTDFSAQLKILSDNYRRDRKAYNEKSFKQFP